MSWEAPPGEASYQQWPPVEAGAVPRRPRRRLVGLIAAAIGASIGLTALCGGAVILTMKAADGDLNRTPPAAVRTLGPPTVSPFGGHYDVPANMCVAGEFTHMLPLFPDVDGIGPDSSTTSDGAAVRECHGVSGNSAISGRFRLIGTFYPDAGAAATAFLAVVKSGPGVMVPGLGQEAWVYRDPDRGRTVIAHDENLVLAMSWRDAAQSTVDPDDLDRTLTEVCRATMRTLR